MLKICLKIILYILLSHSDKMEQNQHLLKENQAFEICTILIHHQSDHYIKAQACNWKLGLIFLNFDLKMTTSKQIFSFGQKVNGGRAPVVAWSHDSSYLAVGTERKYVYIVDKRGKVLVQKQLPNAGRVQFVDWDNEDQVLAILTEGATSVLLWAPFTTNLLDELQFQNQKFKITWLKWSSTHPVLTCGNEKGYLNFYFKKNKRKVPTMGKHSKRVICGDWNNEGLLVTGSQDKLITISNHNSDNAANSLAVKAEPRDLKWMTMKTEERNKKQTTICGVFNQKTLLIHDITQDRSAPLELMFESKYGKIIDYQFYGDGYIVVGFGEGYYCHVSTHEKEMKDEIKSERVFNAPLEAIAVNNPFYKLALAGENKVKIISLGDWKEIKQETVELPPGSGKVAAMNFSPNGTTLIIITQNGLVYGYILSTAVLISTYNELVAMLSSLSEVVILSCSSKKKGQLINTINLPFEPAGISLGPNHLAARLGNTVKFYRWLRDKVLISGGEQVNEIQCEYNIKRIEVGDGWVALLDDKNKLHLIEIENKQTKEKVFPVEGDRQIIQFFITKVFLIYLDNTSRLKYYHIEDKNVIMEHKPDNPILRIFPNKNGTKIILQHQNGEINLFFPTTESYHHLNLVTDRVDKVIWDNENLHEFVIINGNTAFSYIISKNNIFGNIVASVNQILSLQKADTEEGEPTSTKVEKNVLTLSQGNIFFMTGVTVSYLPLTSHAFLTNYSFENDNFEGHTRFFFANLSLKRFQQCLIAAKYLRAAPFYDILGKKALENLEIEISLKSYQMGKNLAMVLTLEPLLHENERDLLIGHVAMILGKYDLAQEYYLKSSQPLNALDMRCDIQDWFIATSLTKNIAPEQESFITKRLATQTQSLGNNTEALKQFQKSVINNELKSIAKPVVEKHNVQCFAGIARTSIKLGDIQRGFNIARDIKDKSLLTDIAVVCENLKQYLEAAQIYEKAENFEKAATLYLQLKMFKQAAPIMDKVTSKSIQIKYGKAKESEGAFKEAEEAYEKAESWEDVVRINLSNFDNLQKPKNILRNKCSTSTVASIVANYCQKRGFWKEAVEFSIMANRKEEAFVMAQSHGEMDTYADYLKECSVEERNQIAVYYESKSMWDKAAKQYDEAKNPLKALKLYIKAGEIFIDKMLDLIERNSNQEHLIQELLDYLMGETDGQPKDPIFTYNLYRILKNFRNAAKIAVTIASTEQQNGEYKKAHQILVQSYQDIKKANVPIPLQLQKKLSILHSYIIVNSIVSKLDQAVDTALLWNKISKNILQFPKHASSILTKCVYAAMRADLKGLAYTWAIVAFRPEYRTAIPQKAVDKIKKVAMKPVNDETPDPKSPCPFCKELVSDYSQDCAKCLNYVPYCIASGRHVVADDLAHCKHCKFYCNYSSMKKALSSAEVEKTCPMCQVQIGLDDIIFLGENGVAGLKKPPPPKQESSKQKK